MPKKLRWLRSPTGSDGKPWENWRLSQNRTRCWPGTESSSPPSSTDRSLANPGVVPELTRKPSGWWCGWRRKIPGGDMTGSWAPWPTWVCGCRIRRWAIFSAAMIFHRLPSGSRQRVGKTLSVLTWRYWWRPTSSRWKCLGSEGDYVLRAVFHSFGESQDMLGRSYASSESRVDGPDGAQCDHGRFWFSDQPQVPTCMIATTNTAHRFVR